MMSEVSRIWVIAFLVTCGCIAVKGQIGKFMQWMDHPNPKTAVTARINDNEIYDWYPGGPPMIVGVFGMTNITIRIHCKVKKLEEKFKLTKMTFEDKFRNKLYIMKKKAPVMYDWTGVATYDPLTGGVATFRVDKAEPEYPSSERRHIAACIASSSSSGILYSSTVEFIDFRKSFKSLGVTKEDIPSLSKNQPMTFKAYPKALIIKALRRPVTFEWFYTPVPLDKISNETKGEPLLDIEPFNYWPVQVTSIGQLYWSFMTEKAVKTLKGKRIFVKAEGHLLAMYGLPATISESGNSLAKLQIIDPKVDNKAVAFWTGLLGHARVPCVFAAGPGLFKIFWKLGNVTLKSGYNKDLGVTFTRNYVEFVGPFKAASRKDALECKVTWTRKGGGRPTETVKKAWAIDQTNIYIPTLKKKLSPYAFAKDGKVTVECEFTNPVGITTSANIFGLETKSLDRTDSTLAAKLKDVKKAYNITLDSTLSPTCCPMDPTKPIIYRSSNLKNDGKGDSSSHPFSCTAKLTKDLFDDAKKKDVFFTRQVLVVVPPKTSFKKTPSTWNCNDCDLCDKKNQIFTSFQVTGIMNIPQIHASFEWTFKSDTKETKLPDSVVESGRFGSRLNLCELSKKKIVEKLGLLEGKASNLSGVVSCSAKLIDSWNNRALNSNSFSVTINIPLKSGFPAWATAIIIIVIILAIALTVFLVWWFKFRPAAENQKGSHNHDGNEGNAMLGRNEARAIPL